MKSVELRQERKAFVDEARSIVNRAEAEHRDMSADESASYNSLMSKVDNHGERIERLEALEKLETDNNATPADAEKMADRKKPSLDIDHRAMPQRVESQDEVKASDKYAAAFRGFVRNGSTNGLYSVADHDHPSFRDLSLGSTTGGSFVTPTKIADEIIKQINNICFVRQFASIETVTDAVSLGVPQMTTRASAANWTSEVASVTADSAIVTARRALTPGALTKLVLVSMQSLRVNPNVEKFVTDELSYQFGVTEEAAYMTGSGSSQPLGIFTASSNGIATTYDYALASSTTFTMDELIGVRYTIKQNYLTDPSAGWIFNKAVASIARKLKDSQNRYLWDISVQRGTPDSLLGVPVYLSEYAPSTMTTGLYCFSLGNLRYYKIAEVQDVTIQRLVEKYADTNQVGFIGRKWIDASPVLGEAFIRGKLA